MGSLLVFLFILRKLMLQKSEHQPPYLNNLSGHNHFHTVSKSMKIKKTLKQYRKKKKSSMTHFPQLFYFLHLAVILSIKPSLFPLRTQNYGISPKRNNLFGVTLEQTYKIHTPADCWLWPFRTTFLRSLLIIRPFCIFNYKL